MSSFDSEIDDLIDNFELKPITDGLGFHHSLKEKKEVTLNLKSQSDSLQNDIQKRISHLDKPEVSKNVNSVNMGELAPFYSANLDTPIAKEINLEVREEVSYSEPSISIRLCAWSIDVFVLITIMMVTFTGMMYFSKLPMESLNVFMISDELFISLMLITTMFYVFYFSFLDKTSYSTVGKRLMDIKVVSTDGAMSLTQAFFRSCFTLISIPLLGLPLILKIHDKITDTMIVESNEG